MPRAGGPASCRPPVDAPAFHNLAELTLHANEAQARHVAGLELHEHVDVAPGAEIIAKHGAVRSSNHDLRRRDPALAKALNLLVLGSIPSGLTILKPNNMRICSSLQPAYPYVRSFQGHAKVTSLNQLTHR